MSMMLVEMLPVASHLGPYPALLVGRKMELPVLCEKLKICLQMSASRTGLRSLLAFMEITAVATAPDHRFVFSEDLIGLDVS